MSNIVNSDHPNPTLYCHPQFLNYINTHIYPQSTDSNPNFNSCSSQFRVFDPVKPLAIMLVYQDLLTGKYPFPQLIYLCMYLCIYKKVWFLYGVLLIGFISDAIIHIFDLIVFCRSVLFLYVNKFCCFWLDFVVCWFLWFDFVCIGDWVLVLIWFDDVLVS